MYLYRYKREHFNENKGKVLISDSGINTKQKPKIVDDYGINFKEMPNGNDVEKLKKIELSETLQNNILNMTVEQFQIKAQQLLDSPGYVFS